MVYMIGGGFYVTNIPFWMSWLQYISTMLNCFYILLSLDYSNTEYRYIQLYSFTLSDSKVFV